jgi:hypothetical protein
MFTSLSDELGSSRWTMREGGCASWQLSRRASRRIREHCHSKGGACEGREGNQGSGGDGLASRIIVANGRAANPWPATFQFLKG